jgi:cytochrome c-type biogenesis protein CcmH/NrfG
MAAEKKELKGFVKTESLILTTLIALALGFLGGVVFSAYRSGGQIKGIPAAESASIPMDDQQRQLLAELIQKTNADPLDVNAWTQLGHLYFDTGQPALAIDAYQKSLQIEAGRPDVWTDLGVMYRRNRQPQKAIEAFDHALSLNQRHEIALFNKGVVLMHDLNDPEGALSSWENLIRINPQAKTPDGQLVREIVDKLRKSGKS